MIAPEVWDTAIDIAISNPYKKILDFILEKYINEICPDYLKSAFKEAVGFGYQDSMELILRNHADMITSHTWNESFIKTVESGHHNITKFILENKPNDVVITPDSWNKAFENTKRPREEHVADGRSDRVVRARTEGKQGAAGAGAGLLHWK